MQIRVQGLVIQLLRYKIDYIMEEINMTEYAQTKKEADVIAEMRNGTITTLDTAEYEWIDGVVVEETNMPYEKAMEIANMGEQGYKEYVEKKKKQNPDTLVTEYEELKQQVLELQMSLVEIYEQNTKD